MQVNIKQIEGVTFIGKADSNHWVTIDGPKTFFGSEAAARPMELLLISLGACTASDVASILKKIPYRQNLATPDSTKTARLFFFLKAW